MPSLSAQKLIRKLRQRKYRWQEQLFVAEGPKLVQDLINSGLEAQYLWSSNQFPQSEAVDDDWLQKLSHLSSANKVLAVFPFPKMQLAPGRRLLVLDGINDPGNLGTLLRTADWFGFRDVICTPGSADVYNAKTVQSTMGSLARLNIAYCERSDILREWSDYQFMVAEMEGLPHRDLKSEDYPKLALIMGSESHGPSADWKESGRLITIKRKQKSDIDSLNVAVAGGILMQHFAFSPDA